MSNYSHIFPNADHAGLHTFLQDKHNWLSQPKKGFLRYQEPLKKISHLRASSCCFKEDIVTIGTPEELNADEALLVSRTMQNLMPWRKGPFSIFGIDIDAEWRSEKKWNRIAPQLPELKGKLIADIGCNNGYYMFRMTEYNPRFVLGFEPYVHHYYTFRTLNTFANQKNLDVELLGIEHLPFFPDSFDVIFCLGILYHRHSPIVSLQDMHNALTQDGTLIIESQAIPGEESLALFPEKTYAKVPGTWFVPTASCLNNWLQRTGFRDISLFCQHPMSSLEQRRTKWMTFESYEDFIDKQNPTLTIEGYPAPHRVFFKATK
ncbi:tRNA 5-methoxyuridine(34)/uridine 5-oxyacetic acid(34) synthase CmoB [Desulfogranum marinum]|uniref:tRNA 5-methoxyuridine(34)/uridine 5-oxyacetic acid(34) synthase CmoB n=1 Tax=Desulfogranum marinum TaxID=453220 RepID=UPI00196353F7|nr:tRNA 5-methoxyuridine(34)/uridine 5-oxyacetic acid(34) synthase CmoB [Desulfogranum marinum]MBM9511405.1 tRNA 5-methoxyuridine(34)/uridine 5-oxyacetic acid(34) synthase CmoB [Desulfogranum marinum]